MATSKLREALVELLPAVNSANNAQLADVIGRKDDVSGGSIVALIKAIAALSCEIDEHFKSSASWFEKAGTPDGEDHVADRIGTVGGLGPFIIDGGDHTWGDWVQILGADDTPARIGNTKFHFHELQMTGNERDADYFFQIGFGESGAAALAAGTYTEKALTFSGLNEEKWFSTQNNEHIAGTKVWARCSCPSTDTGTLDFYFGLHEHNS